VTRLKTGLKYLCGAFFLLLILTTCVMAAPVPPLAASEPEVEIVPLGLIQLAQAAITPPATQPPTVAETTPEATTPTIIPPEPTYDPDAIITDGYLYPQTEDPIETIMYEPDEEPAPRRPMIALTFDDGPTRFTNQILDTLAEHNARATFFVLGELVIENPLTTRRIVQEGHELLGHTWNHRDMTRLSRDNIANTITRTSNVLYGMTGSQTRLFRPPYGATNTRVVEVAAELGYAIIMWTVDPQDWRASNQSVEHIYNHIIRNAYDGAIVVLHDVFATTADAMEAVIPRLIADGFDLVTVSELLDYFFDDIVPGRIYHGIWR